MFFLLVMKVRSQNYNLSFKAGMTNAIKQEIASCDPKKISKYLDNLGIINNLQDNKVIAWCSLKTIEALKKLKQKMPVAVFVEDFKKLSVGNSDVLGGVNLAPMKLIKDKDIVFPENTIFFNANVQSNLSSKSFWENLDQEVDFRFATKLSATDSFLEPFFHEFAHVLHSHNLKKNLGETKRLEVLAENLSVDKQVDFSLKYGRMLRNKICSYAGENFIEAIACDLAARFGKNLDAQTLFVKDFFPNSPYAKFTLKSLFSKKQDMCATDELLKNLWNGKVL